MSFGSRHGRSKIFWVMSPIPRSPSEGGVDWKFTEDQKEGNMGDPYTRILDPLYCLSCAF